MTTPSADVSTLWLTVNHMGAAFLALMPHLAVALVVFAAFWFGARLVRGGVIASLTRAITPTSGW